MRLYLLGISRTCDAAIVSASPLSPCKREAGIEERDECELQWVVGADLAVAVAPIQAEPPHPLQHASVLQALHRRIDILPARCGTVLPSQQAVQDLLQRRQADLLHALQRLQGTAEMGLRIDVCLSRPAHDAAEMPDTAEAPAVAPAQYLAGRRSLYQWRDRCDDQSQMLIDDHTQRLAGLYRQWRRLPSAEPAVVRLAFLVERQHTAGFRARLQVRSTVPWAARATLVGPWPPYSFV
jgi:hypothetical protein